MDDIGGLVELHGSRTLSYLENILQPRTYGGQ